MLTLLGQDAGDGDGNVGNKTETTEMAAISTDLTTPTINEGNEATQDEVETISTQPIVADSTGVNGSHSSLLVEKTDESSHLEGKHEEEHEGSPTLDDEPGTESEKEAVDTEPAKEEKTTSDSSNETSNIKKLAAILFAVPVAQILHFFL